MNRNTFRLAPIALAVALGSSIGGAYAADASNDVQDARREAQIWTTYGFNSNLRAMEISVDVNGPAAVLTGTVESSVEKDLAEQIALGVEGIKKVDNQIKVDANYTPPKRVSKDRDFSTTVDDATTTAKVKSKLLWNNNTDGLQINVDTRDGAVTLKGSADTPAEKDLAARLALNTPGVLTVNNQISVSGKKRDDVKKSVRGAKDDAKNDTEFAAAEMKDGAREAGNDVSDAWITAKVKSTFAFSRNVDASDINVDTKNGVVKLSGKVDSQGERDYAIELAKDIRGVKKVDSSGLKS